MLVELAVGDAYGAGFEYASKNLHLNDLSRYVAHPRHHEICPSCYTDDTQMSLAIAELIVEGIEWTPLNIANKLVEVFKRDERTGYAGRFYEFLKSVKDGQEFLKRIKPHSEKSGAPMRATPYQGKGKSKGWMSVRAAITAIRRNTSLSALLIDCVNFTGDVDTVATIALATASMSREYKQDLPEHLTMSLENGRYGREYITDLDRKLLAFAQ